MASIVKRNNSYCVVYTYKHTNGTQKQKWETFTDLADAKNRKKEVEYKESVGTFVAPQCRTLKDLLTEYVALYGKTLEGTPKLKAIYQNTNGTLTKQKEKHLWFQWLKHAEE